MRAGGPGVGKARLSGELLARKRGRVVALTARGHRLGVTAPFDLWVEALEGHLRRADSAQIVRLCGGFLDALAGLLGSVAAGRGAAPLGAPPPLRARHGLARLVGGLA